MQKLSCACLGVVWKFSDEIHTVFLAAFVFGTLQNIFRFAKNYATRRSLERPFQKLIATSHLHRLAVVHQSASCVSTVPFVLGPVYPTFYVSMATFVTMSVCPRLCLSMCLHVCGYDCQRVCMSTALFVHVSICSQLLVHGSIHGSVCSEFFWSTAWSISKFPCQLCLQLIPVCPFVRSNRPCVQKWSLFVSYCICVHVYLFKRLQADFFAICSKFI